MYRPQFEIKLSSKPKKIAILLPDLRGGGVERIRLILAHEFARQGYVVEFVLMRVEGEFLAEAQANFSVVDLGTARARQVPLALALYLRRNRPDALLAAIWPLTVLAPIGRALSGHRCKVLVSEHNTLSIQYGAWGWVHNLLMRSSMAIGYRIADVRVGVSAGVAKDVAQLAWLPVNVFDVIHNPVARRPEPDPLALAAAHALWLGVSGTRVLTVGSLKAQKNHPLLLRAFARLVQLPAARLMFLGAGSCETELRALADDLGIADRVIFAGFHSDPSPFYRSADLFVLSSDYEGFGNVIAEALAGGTPVVSTDCPSGPSEILDGGRYGTLVPVGDVEALADAIGAALTKTHDQARLRQRALDFAPEIAASRYLKLLA